MNALQTLAHNALRGYVRSFPVQKGKQRVVTALWKPLSFGQYQLQSALKYQNLRVHCDLTRLIQRQLYFWGSYEDELLQEWMQRAHESFTIFDVGANIGIYSLTAAAAHPHAEIHAFEPTPELVHALTGNVQLNGLHNVIINRTAVGGADGSGALHRCEGSDSSNEGMNFVTPEEATASTNETNADHTAQNDTVQVVSLDSYCRAHNISFIDLMKVDVEGGEYDVLAGAQTMLSEKAIGCIFIELAEWAANRSGHSVRDVVRLLTQAGYALFHLDSSGLVPLDLTDIPEGTNAIALAPSPSSSRPSPT